LVTLGSRDPQRLGTPGDGWGAAAVSGPRETVEKEVVEAPSLYHLRRDGIFTASILLSQVISNVPMVALYLPLMRGLGLGPGNVVAWVGLAAASTIAGNLTLIGAASNIIVLQASEKRGGPRLSYLEFLMYGIPVTLVNALIYYVYLNII